MTKIAIIGYGNVGYHLANRLSRRNEVSIFSRNPVDEEVLPMSDLVPGNYEFIILSVPDGVVKDVSSSFNATDAIVLHTSGSRPLSDVAHHPRHGVMYPLQTFSRAKPIDFDTFPIFVEGNDDGEMKAYSLARTIGNDVRLITSANRAKLHLAAVFACNFSNHMFHLAEKFLGELDMEFQDIKSLVEETYIKAIDLGPSNAQTGPAMRGDQLTINTHMDMIKDQEVKALYKMISEHIQALR